MQKKQLSILIIASFIMASGLSSVTNAGAMMRAGDHSPKMGDVTEGLPTINEEPAATTKEGFVCDELQPDATGEIASAIICGSCIGCGIGWLCKLHYCGDCRKEGR